MSVNMGKPYVLSANILPKRICALFSAMICTGFSGAAFSARRAWHSRSITTTVRRHPSPRTSTIMPSPTSVRRVTTRMSSNRRRTSLSHSMKTTMRQWRSSSHSDGTHGGGTLPKRKERSHGAKMLNRTCAQLHSCAISAVTAHISRRWQTMIRSRRHIATPVASAYARAMFPCSSCRVIRCGRS